MEKEISSYKILTGIHEVIDQYDAFIISEFGVLHDRTSLIPGARGCLEKLADHGKTVMILTNSPRRTSTLIQKLAQFGIPPSLYQHILSSGEEAFHHLSQRSDPWHATLGRYCYYMGSTDDDNLIEDLRVYPVSDISRADFILAVGFDIWHQDLKYYDKILREAVALRLPMVCANPDVYIYDQGEKHLRAGYLAKRYQEYGGQVRFHGKPYKPFFDQALSKLKRFDQKRLLVVGDSMETDILGGTMAGLMTAYIATEHEAFNLLSKNGGQQTFKEHLEQLFREFRLEPNYVIPYFIW